MLAGIVPKCWILALVVRDDGERILLGDGAFEFQEKQQHFIANTYVNDTVEVQGNDGVMLAGQVRRGSAQPFDGYIADATVDGSKTETYRRQFLSFFRKNHLYSVIYILPDGTAVKRQRGFIVDAPEVQESRRVHPEYHVALNFEDLNYYAYAEDDSGEEIYSDSATIPVISSDSGGLVWDTNGVVWFGESSRQVAESLGNTSQSRTPTPSSPQQVKVATGTQTITIGGSTFEVDLGAVELCQVGEYQDKIYKNNGDWYIRREVRHLSYTIADMNNSENFPGWKNVSILQEDFDPSLNGGLATVTSYYTNINGYVATNPSETNPDVSANVVSGHLFLPRGYWGSSHNQTYWKTNFPDLTFELYYGINTPQDAQITDAELIAQLEALSEIVFDESVTPTVSGDLAVNLSISEQPVASGAVWDGDGGGGIVDIEVDSIDNVYPLLTITGPANNPSIENITTGTALGYSGNITSDQTLVINMNDQTAKLNGTNVIKNLSGDWLYFAPGINKVSYSASNNDAPEAMIEWSEVVG